MNSSRENQHQQHLPANISRRDMLRLSGAGALALSLNVDSVFAASAIPAPFRFIMVNDIHSRDERCEPWFQKVVASMRTHKPDFCIINGDLSDNGSAAQIGVVKKTFGNLGIPLYATIGNHDYAEGVNRPDGPDHTAFSQAFPDSINHHFEHNGWQFIGLDSTQGHDVVFTNIQPATFAWLDATLPKLDSKKPTVVFTHFPLGQLVVCRPTNADDLLKRFDQFNLAATFSGHWHGYAERHFDHATVTNSRCCSWWRANSDGSPDKGYFLCEATPDGRITHQFCVISA